MKVKPVRGGDQRGSRLTKVKMTKVPLVKDRRAR